MDKQKYKMTEEHKKKIGLANAIKIKEYWKIHKPTKKQLYILQNSSKIKKKKYGYVNSLEARKKVSESMRQRWSEGNVTGKQKQVLFKEGKDTRRMATQFKVGHKTPESWKIKMREKRALQVGENHPNWHGGISFEPYGKEFNRKLKEKIRQRDQYRCQECFRHQNELRDSKNKKYRLLVHHIDFNKKNNSEENLISLCRPCHLQTNYNREDWTNHFNDVLNWRKDN